MFTKPYLWVLHCFPGCNDCHGHERAKCIHPITLESKKRGEGEKDCGTDRTKRQKGWNRLAGIKRRQMIVRIGRWDKHTGRWRDKLHAMNSAVSSSPPCMKINKEIYISSSCHSHQMTTPILSVPPSPQSHKKLILSSQSEHHIKLVHCFVWASVCMLGCTWLGRWPHAVERINKVGVCVCV